MTAKKPKEKHKLRGAPSKYKDNVGIRFAFHLAEEGLTDKQIVEKMGINETTLTNWKKTYPDFFMSLKEEKEKSDQQIVATLREKALGYTRTEKETIITKSGPVDVPITKRFEPDTTSIIFWLKNRQPDKWRDKHDVNHTGSLNIHFDKEDEGVI